MQYNYKQHYSFKNLLIEFFRLCNLAIKLFLKRFFKPLIILLIVSLYLVYIYFQPVIGFFGRLDYELIHKYFATILSMPVAILVIVLTFMKRFKKGIVIFLKNSRLKGVGPASVDQKERGQETKTIDNTSETNVLPILETTKSKEDFMSPEETKKFFLLKDNFLTLNSKLSLLWFYNKPDHTATKKLFIDTYTLSGFYDRPENEKENIFLALYNEKLIEPTDNSYKVSERGRMFLEYIGLVPKATEK